MMEKLKDLLKSKRTELKLTQEEFSVLLGHSKSYLGLVETDRIVPSLNVLEIFSKKYNVPYAMLKEMYDKESEELEKLRQIETAYKKGLLGIDKTYESIQEPAPLWIHLLDKSVAPEPLFTMDGLPILDKFKSVVTRHPGTFLISAHDWGYFVTDDSMEPAFPKGTLVIVSPAVKAKSGDLVVAKTKKKSLNDYLFNYMDIHEDRYIFRGLNPTYKTRVFKKNELHFVHKTILILPYPEHYLTGNDRKLLK